MPALFVFLLKVNVALLLFCLGYYLVLRRLTFYTLNRVYLVTAIMFSTGYPLININSFVQKHNIPVQKVIVDWKISAENFVSPPVQQTDYRHWAMLLFWAGAALFAARLLMQLLSLYNLYKNSKPGNIQDYKVRIVKADINPFSFWQSIYINPDNLDPNDLNNVLQHELVHVREWHTLDILLTEISAIFYWFNPGIWLTKKAVRENIEFITDRKILRKGVDSKKYQYSLVNVSFNNNAHGIVNHFNLSTIKKRIIMMNTKKSSKFNLASYAFVIPIIIVLLLIFGISKAKLAIQINRSSAGLIKAVKTVVNKMSLKPESLKINKYRSGVITQQIPNNVADTDKKALSILKADTGDLKNKPGNPIIIIDGIPYTGPVEDFDFENANELEYANLLQIHDIKNITFLKGIDATTALGAKAANGALIIETNRKTTVEGRITHIMISNERINSQFVTSIVNGKEVIDSVKAYDLPIPKHYAVVTSEQGNTTVPGIIKSNRIDLTGKLLVIDGKKATEDNLMRIHPANIKSISELDDYSARVIYGDKDNKGVVEVFTKKN